MLKFKPNKHFSPRCLYCLFYLRNNLQSYFPSQAFVWFFFIQKNIFYTIYSEQTFLLPQILLHSLPCREWEALEYSVLIGYLHQTTAFRSQESVHERRHKEKKSHTWWNVILENMQHTKWKGFASHLSQ